MLPLISRIMLSCDEPKLSRLMLPYQTMQSSMIAYPALQAHTEPPILWHRIKILSTAVWT